MRDKDGLSSVTAGVRAAMLYVGTIIGAGFASGRELLTFFDGGIQGYVMAVVAGVLFYLSGLVCMNIGRHTATDNLFKITHSLFKNYGLVLNFFIAFCYLILIGGMLAGADALINQSVGYQGFPIASTVMLIAALITVSYGLKGLKGITTVLVPCIIVILVVVCQSALSQSSVSAFPYQDGTNRQLPLSFVYCVLYVAFNILLSAAVLSSAGKTLKTKEINTACIIASVIITVVMVLLISALSKYYPEIHGEDLPLLALAEKLSGALFGVSSAVIFLAIFITLASSLYPLISFLRSFFKKDLYIFTITAIVSLLLSRIGFSNIVSYLYPVQGVIGTVFILLCARFLHKNKNQSAMLPQITE